MFIGNVNQKALLYNKEAEDSYILYKGKMVSANLIDIEVIFQKQPDIRRKLMVDTHDEMRILTNRVSEVCELFPKLSGLNGLVPLNFKKKTDNGFIDLKQIGYIGEYILPKDSLYFDLHFYETWLDIEMALESRNRSYIIRFELKVQLNSVRSTFEDILINLGIQSWAKIVSDDYYAFTDLIVYYPSGLLPSNNSTNINTNHNHNNNHHHNLNNSSSSNKFNHLSSNNTLNHIFNSSSFVDNLITFDFDSKLKCRLIFTNISDMLLDQSNQASKVTSHSFTEKPSDTKSNNNHNSNNAINKLYLNNYFEDWLSTKTDSIAVYKQIIWRFQSQSQYDDVIIIDEDNSSCSDADDSLNISAKSISVNHEDEDDNDKADSTGNFTNYNQASPIHSPIANRGRSFENHQKTQQAFFTSKYKTMKTSVVVSAPLDYSAIVNKYASLYVPLKDFHRTFPNTRNLVELCNDVIEAFEIEVKDANTNYDHKDIWKVNDRFKLKKWIGVIGVILGIFVIYKVLL